MATYAYAPYIEYGDGYARPRDHLGPGGTIRVPVPEERIWYDWVERGPDEYPTPTYTTATIEPRWTTAATTTATFTTTGTTTGYNRQVWVNWVAQVDEFTAAMQQAGQAARRMAQVREPLTHEETEAQRAALREAQQAQRDRAQARRERENAALLAERKRVAGAQERALVLFESLLTKEERRHWKLMHKKAVRVRGENGTLFEIRTQDSVHGNVTEVDEHGCRLGSVCVAPSMLDKATNLHLPLADGWVGQLLCIRHNLADFRAKGNWSFRRECAQQRVGAPVPELAQMMREDGLEVTIRAEDLRLVAA